MRPREAAPRQARAPQRFDDEFEGCYRRVPREHRRSSTRPSLDASPMAGPATASGSFPTDRRRKRGLDDSTLDTRHSRVTAHEYRLAGREWYHVQRDNAMKRNRTPSPAPSPTPPSHHQDVTLLSVLRRYVLPTDDGPKPTRKPNHEQALQDARLRARPSFEKKLHRLESTAVCGGGGGSANPSTFERQRNYLARSASYRDALLGDVAAMDDSDDGLELHARQQLPDRRGQSRAGLKQGFAALHLSLRVAIISEIVEEAADMVLPFHDANEAVGSASGVWPGGRVERSFYPSEKDFYRGAVGSVAPAAPMVPSAARHVLDTRTSGRRHNSLGALVEAAAPHGCESAVEGEDSAYINATLSRESAVKPSSAERTFYMAPGTTRTMQAYDFHDPEVPGQLYYPADQLFGMSEEEVKETIARHRREYRNEPAKAASPADVAEAEEFLKMYKLPKRWLDMWTVE